MCTHRVGTQLGRDGLARGRAFPSCLLLFFDIQCGEEAGQNAEIVDDGHLARGVRL